MLENLGFSAIDERSYHIRPRFSDGERDVDAARHGAGDRRRRRRSSSSATTSGWKAASSPCCAGEADNDGFNRLIVSAGADWREAAVLRAYAAYLRQLGSPFGLRYLADTLTRHAGLARDLLELFHLRFDPHRGLSLPQRQAAEAPVRQRIEGALAAVPSLDEDRILRQFLNLVDATVRTNFYQSDADGRPPATLAFKFDSKAVEAAPQPRPFREIWVYSPRVEGVHLRFAPIARGGIRWSDRAQDFRTEVLGLVRAQLVKNAVIVPSGAKGGFLPKQLPRTRRPRGDPEGRRAAYRIFISALLDITDNIKDGKVVPPRAWCATTATIPTWWWPPTRAPPPSPTSPTRFRPRTASGSATPSPRAARPATTTRGWRITARGAWECVKRHFREMDIDIQRQPFRVVGVGDMSGDVFGNGMLLSEQSGWWPPSTTATSSSILIPVPAAASPSASGCSTCRARAGRTTTRRRSPRAAACSRAQPSRLRSASEMQEAAGASMPQALTPAELIRAILKCKTDLLWFGGIGTYVRASTETDAEVGDRANDALRVTARRGARQGDRRGRQPRRDAARAHRVRAHAAGASTPTSSTIRRA